MKVIRALSAPKSPMRTYDTHHSIRLLEHRTPQIPSGLRTQKRVMGEAVAPSGASLSPWWLKGTIGASFMLRASPVNPGGSDSPAERAESGLLRVKVHGTHWLCLTFFWHHVLSFTPVCSSLCTVRIQALLMELRPRPM